jgi:hypothetical protein
LQLAEGNRVSTLELLWHTHLVYHAAHSRFRVRDMDGTPRLDTRDQS